MAKTLQIKRGPQEQLPLLAEGELGFTLDTKRLFIGAPAGNVEITSVLALAEHDGSTAAHPALLQRIEALESGNAVLKDRVQVLEDILATNITENRHGVYFDNQDAVSLIRGNYNAALQRIECTKGEE